MAEANAVDAVSPLLDLQDPLDRAEKMVTMESLANPDKMDQTLHLHPQLSPTMPASIAPRDHQDRPEMQDPRDHPEDLETMDSQDSQEMLEEQDQWDHPDHQETMDNPEAQDSQELQDRFAKFQDQKAHLDHQDHQEVLEMMDNPDTPETPEHQASKDLPETTDRMATQETLDNPDSLETMERREAKAAAATAHHQERLPDIKHQQKVSSSVVVRFLLLELEKDSILVDLIKLVCLISIPSSSSIQLSLSLSQILSILSDMLSCTSKRLYPTLSNSPFNLNFVIFRVFY